MDDFDFFFKIKCEDNNIFWTGHVDKPSRENLYIFFQKTLDNADREGFRRIYIIADSNTPVGYLYFIPNEQSKDVYGQSIAISSQFQGKGYAKEAVIQGLTEGKRLGFKKMHTTIREDNIASLRVHKACGVQIKDTYDLVYIPILNKEVKMFDAEIELG